MRLDSLDKLRAHIQHIEGRTNMLSGAGETPLKGQGDNPDNQPSPPAWSFGAPQIDQFFSGGLSPCALHEITPAHYLDSWAAQSFALALLSCRTHHDQRPVLWCSAAINGSEFGRLYGHGLKRFGLDPARFILIETKNHRETAFVLEEALRSNRLAGVLGIMDAPDFIVSRRLSLVAASGRTPALLMTKPGDPGIKSAATRWQITTPSPDRADVTTSSFHPFNWQVALLRNRQGPADKQWHLEFPVHDPSSHTSSDIPCQQTFRFALASPSCHREPQTAAA